MKKLSILIGVLLLSSCKNIEDRVSESVDKKIKFPPDMPEVMKDIRSKQKSCFEKMTEALVFAQQARDFAENARVVVVGLQGSLEECNNNLANCNFNLNTCNTNLQECLNDVRNNQNDCLIAVNDVHAVCQRVEGNQRVDIPINVNCPHYHRNDSHPSDLGENESISELLAYGDRLTNRIDSEMLTNRVANENSEQRMQEVRLKIDTSRIGGGYVGGSVDCMSNQCSIFGNNDHQVEPFSAGLRPSNRVFLSPQRYTSSGTGQGKKMFLMSPRRNDEANPFDNLSVIDAESENQEEESYASQTQENDPNVINMHFIPGQGVQIQHNGNEMEELVNQLGDRSLNLSEQHSTVQSIIIKDENQNNEHH